MSDQSDRPAGSTGGCGCQGAGPILTDFMKRMAPDEQVRQHFRTARIEFLKGLRAIIDQRIDDLSKSQQPKGSKIVVE
jgi:hypothetical protein